MKNNYLEHVLVMLDQIEEKFRNTFGHLTTEQLSWQPNEKSWSVGSCIDHLVLSNEMYYQVLSDVKTDSQYKGIWTKLPLWNTIWGKILIGSVDPKKNKKTKTTKDLDHIGHQYTHQIVQDFLSSQAALKQLAKDLDYLDHHKIVIAFPTIKSITMKMNVAFEVLWKHELKHYNQAVRVMESEGFPN
ncbi:MAG: DinB family protein [Chitinophagales bacterium]